MRNEQNSHFLRLRPLNAEENAIYSIPKKRRTGDQLLAASSEVQDKLVQMLLDNGADVNAQGEEYGNALQAASSEGYDQVVQMLLDKGADVTLRVVTMVTLYRQRHSKVMIKWCRCCLIKALI